MNARRRTLISTFEATEERPTVKFARAERKGAGQIHVHWDDRGAYVSLGLEAAAELRDALTLALDEAARSRSSPIAKAPA